MTVTSRHKTYAVLIAAAVIVAGTVAGSVWSNQKIAKLERSAAVARQNAEITENQALQLELKAAEYEQKIKYLEGTLSEIETIARKQDEQIKQMATDTNSARDGVRRARAVRRIESTNAELCAKLAELGHPCAE